MRGGLGLAVTVIGLPTDLMKFGRTGNRQSDTHHRPQRPESTRGLTVQQPIHRKTKRGEATSLNKEPPEPSMIFSFG